MGGGDGKEEPQPEGRLTLDLKVGGKPVKAEVAYAAIRNSHKYPSASTNEALAREGAIVIMDAMRLKKEGADYEMVLFLKPSHLQGDNYFVLIRATGREVQK